MVEVKRTEAISTIEIVAQLSSNLISAGPMKMPFSQEVFVGEECLTESVEDWHFIIK